MFRAPLRIDRRAFLSCAADALACVVGVRAYRSVDAQTPTRRAVQTISPSLRIGIVMVARNDELALSSMGIDQGLDEATRAASLLGHTVQVVARADSIAGATELVRRERPSAILCAAAAEDIVELGGECASLSTPLFNLAAADDSLRNDRCARFTFHVCASDAMRESARRAVADSSARPDTTIEIWHPRLERFGAAQLNDRFRSRFHRSMDSLAWAGWFAVKAASEASLRARATDGSAIGAYLERETAQFDGQKGVPLSFRPWDHQLRQPLYAVGASPSAEPVAVPALSAGSSRADLDVLGTNAETSSCHWR